MNYYQYSAIILFVLVGVIWSLKQLHLNRWRKKIKGGTKCYYYIDTGKKVKGKVSYRHPGLGQYAVTPESADHIDTFKSSSELYPPIY